MTFRLHRPFLFFAALALAGVTVANADPVVFDNGPDNGLGGNNPFSFDDVFVAQDFVLNSDTVLTRLIFNAYTQPGTTVPITTLRVKIYADNAGAVGAQLYGGLRTISQTVDTGLRLDGAFESFDFYAQLPNWQLSAGVYWLALQADPAQEQLHWSLTDTGAGPYVSYIGDHTGTPGAYGYYNDLEHVYRLEGRDPVPHVPDAGSTALMLGAALGAFRLVRRRVR